MSGSGSGSGSGGGDGGEYINVGGVSVQIPYVDTTIPYAQELRDMSLCVAILQMANFLSDSGGRTAIHNAVTTALGAESQQFAQEVSTGG